MNEEKGRSFSLPEIWPVASPSRSTHLWSLVLVTSKCSSSNLVLPLRRLKSKFPKQSAKVNAVCKKQSASTATTNYHRLHYTFSHHWLTSVTNHLCVICTAELQPRQSSWVQCCLRFWHDLRSLHVKFDFKRGKNEWGKIILIWCGSYRD